jgi:hypothetical protein
MSRFQNELRVIPRPAWIVASLLAVATLIGAGVFLWPKDMDPWALTLLIFAVPAAALFGIYVLLIGYVYGDSRRRGMPQVVWTLLAIFIPNAIGIILYFLLREPMLHPCPSCGTGCKPGLAYCPNCGASIARSCPQCKYPLEESWKNCPHCGVPVPL